MSKEIEIMNFVNERNAEVNKMEERKVVNKKFNFKGYAKMAILIGATTIALTKLYKYENQPIKIVINEITADSGFNLTDNGKRVSGKMTQEELANYAIENNLTIEQIEEQLMKFSKREGFNYEFIKEEIMEDNEELFKRL